MADSRQKTHHILLATGGKNTTLELFDSRLWPGKSSNDGEFRVRINSKWHSPAGKYTFLSMAAVERLIGTILTGKALPEEEPVPDFYVSQPVRVHFGECVASMPLQSEMGRVAAPPYRGIDGRCYVAVTTFGGTTAHLCHDVTPVDAPGKRRRRK